VVSERTEGVDHASIPSTPQGDDVDTPFRVTMSNLVTAGMMMIGLGVTWGTFGAKVGNLADKETELSDRLNRQAGYIEAIQNGAKAEADKLTTKIDVTTEALTEKLASAETSRQARGDTLNDRLSELGAKMAALSVQVENLNKTMTSLTSPSMMRSSPR
jgi:uncharacterized coiled-coil protein SlyX